MASPYDSAIDMFQLPRFGAGPSPFPRREDPATSARRMFLEGGNAPVQDEDTFIQERASQSPDPFGVMEEVENLRREREEEGFISDIASLDPAANNYSRSLLDLVQKNPRIAQSRGALGLIDVQRKLAPETKDYTSQFRDPLYRGSYQTRVKGGMTPEQAYNETLNEAANEEMAIKLIESGVPIERHGELMTGGIFDRRKVAQAVANQGKEIPRSELNSLLELADTVRKTQGYEPSDEEKRTWYKNKYETDIPSTWFGEGKPAWEEAFTGVRNQKVDEAKKLWDERLKAIEGVYRVPEQIRGLIGGAPVATSPAEQALAPTGSVPAPVEAPVQTSPPAPVADRSQLDQLWTDYMDLQGALNVDSKSTNPADLEAESEIRKEMAPLRQNLMKSLGLKDDDEGKMRFEELFRNRQKSGFKDYSKLWR